MSLDQITHIEIVGALLDQEHGTSTQVPVYVTGCLVELVRDHGQKATTFGAICTNVVLVGQGLGGNEGKHYEERERWSKLHVVVVVFSVGQGNKIYEGS